MKSQSTLPVLLSLCRVGGLGVDQDKAFKLGVGVDGSAIVEEGVEMETPAGDGVALVFCRRAAHDPGMGDVRGGVAYFGPCVQPGRAVANGVARERGSRRCGG